MSVVGLSLPLATAPPLTTISDPSKDTMGFEAHQQAQHRGGKAMLREDKKTEEESPLKVMVAGERQWQNTALSSSQPCYIQGGQNDNDGWVG